ncbi:MAG: SDR family oxidoreductase [Rhodopseudomonas sp.]|uniref:SDR family NAD(P)-dependent oxidoreductase n=1 Tax=Rhodopseudomonas sp. TaxID=1078 RepID=UPI0039E6D761
MSKHVVISGGGTGIGLACAKYFAARNARVAIIGRREQVLRDAASAIEHEFPDAPKVLPFATDLTSAEQVEFLRGEIDERFEHIDVLINAAGGHVQRRFPSSTYADGLAGIARRWTDNFAMNTLSAVLLTEALLAKMRTPGGRILFMSSIAAYRGSGAGCYGAAKAALHPYCFDLAKTLGAKGITVNTIAPGYIADTEFFGSALSEDQYQAKLAETLNNRAGLPSDVANAVGWLTSAEAVHITAQIVQINGGAERGR